MSISARRFYLSVSAAAFFLCLCGSPNVAKADIMDYFDAGETTGEMDLSGDYIDDAASWLGTLFYDESDTSGSTFDVPVTDALEAELDANLTNLDVDADVFTENGQNVDIAYVSSDKNLNLTSKQKELLVRMANKGEGKREKLLKDVGIRVTEVTKDDGSTLLVLSGDFDEAIGKVEAEMGVSVEDFSTDSSPQVDAIMQSVDSSNASATTTYTSHTEAAKHITLPNTGALLGNPVSACMNSVYGMRVHPVTGVYKMHRGIDLAASCGDPIYAAEDGIVEETINTCEEGNMPCGDGYGNHVRINHTTSSNKTVADAKISTYYAHMGIGTVVVTAGQTVKKGDLIGYVGSTGYSTGCHLHFEVFPAGYRNGYSADGEEYDPQELISVNAC